jgi:hypothetical protein
MAPDASLGKILRLIDEHGWAVVGVGGGGCDCAGCDGGTDEGTDDGTEFSYTVGLSTLGFPEVITYGLPQLVAQACLNRIGQQVSAGKPPRVGTMVEHVFQGLRGYLLDASDTSDLVVVGQVYPEIVAAQLIWPDRHGRFPWEAGYDRWRCAQPLIGPPPARRVG